MAILQEANAVFYHPLDDLTETLQTQSWTGAFKDQAGRVALAKGQANASVAYGPSAPLPSAGPNSSFTDATAIDPGHIVGAIVDLNNTVVSCAVGTVTGSSLAYGPKATYSSVHAAAVSVASVSPTKVVVVHNTGSRVGTITGTSIAFGPDTLIPGSPNSSGEHYTEVIALSASVVVATFPSNSPLNTIKAVAGVVGATAVTWASEVTVATLGSVPWIRASAMASDRFIMVYGTQTTSTDPVFVRGAVLVGTLISIPDPAAQADVAHTGTTTGGFSGQGRAAIVSTGASTAILGYFRNASPSVVMVKAVSMPGTAPTIGKASIMSDPVGTDFQTRGLNNPLGDMTMEWDGAHVVLTYSAQFLEGAVSGGGSSGSHEMVTHLMSLNQTGLPVERGRGQTFQNGNISSPRSASTVVTAGKFAVSQLSSGSTTTSIGVITPRGFSATGSDGATSFGAASEFSPIASTVQYIDTSPLDADRFVVTYGYGAGGPQAACRIGTVTGTTVVYGAESLLGQNSAVGAVVALDASTLVAAFTAPTGGIRLKVGAVVGADITFGAEAVGNDVTSDHMSLVRLSATRAALAFSRVISTQKSASAATVTVSGTSATFGATHDAAVAPTAQWLGGWVSAAPIDSTRFAIFYVNPVGAAHDGVCRVGTVAGSDITYGANSIFEITPMTQPGDPVAASLSSSEMVVVWGFFTGATIGRSRIGTVTGTDVTWGPVADFEPTNVGSRSVASAGPSSFVVAYGTAVSTTLSRIGDVSAGVVSYRPPVTMLSQAAANISVGSLSKTRFVVDYMDTATTHGTSKAAAVAAYKASVGATRLAFSTWSRRGLDMSTGASASVATGLTTTSRLAVAPLSDAAYIASYSDGSFVRSRVLTLTGTSISVGPESTVTGAVSNSPADITALSPTKAVFVVGSGATGERKGFVGTVSGTDVTWAAPTQFDTSPTAGINDPIFLDTLDAFRVLLTYGFSGPSGVRRAVVGVVTGTTVSWGPLSTAISNPLGMQGLAVLNQFTAVVAYLTAGTPGFNNVGFQLISISGSAASWAGTPTELPELNRMDNPRIAPIDSTRFLIAYGDASDGASPIFTEPDFQQTFARVVTVSGTDFSVGPKAQLDGSRIRPHGLVRISGRRMLLSYVGRQIPAPGVVWIATIGVDGVVAEFGCSRVATLEHDSPLWLNATGASGGTAVLMTNITGSQIDAMAITVKE